MHEQVHVVIRGQVQGVHFLPWAREQAKQVTVGGWVRYVADGSVEAVFSGKPAAVDRLLDRCKTGPGSARVLDIVAHQCQPPPGAGFQQLPLHEYVSPFLPPSLPPSISPYFLNQRLGDRFLPANSQFSEYDSSFPLAH
jgi:acylphosphatase